MFGRARRSGSGLELLRSAVYPFGCQDGTGYPGRLPVGRSETHPDTIPAPRNDGKLGAPTSSNEMRTRTRAPAVQPEFAAPASFCSRISLIDYRSIILCLPYHAPEHGCTCSTTSVIASLRTADLSCTVWYCGEMTCGYGGRSHGSLLSSRRGGAAGRGGGARGPALSIDPLRAPVMLSRLCRLVHWSTGLPEQLTFL